MYSSKFNRNYFKEMKYRLVEERRNQLAQGIKEAREEFRRGEVKRGTVDDLMREIPE